jgi:hypothetical protein
MTKKTLIISLICLAFSYIPIKACAQSLTVNDKITNEKLGYHDVRVDSDGNLLPWFDDNIGQSFDHAIQLVWNFWDSPTQMRTDLNGLPYYMNHQVWSENTNDPRGLGGDQFQMALSSWLLLYAYTGNERIKQNMKFIADYYLTHSLTPANSDWPNMPYPYNVAIYSGFYDGDMVLGRGFFQPDKSGSLGLELVHLYKMTIGDSSITTTPNFYLDSAKEIARTLIRHLKTGDQDNSPLPFKVNAFRKNGKDVIGELRNNDGSGTVIGHATYTTNWAPTMELFLELERLDPANVKLYQQSFQLLLNWMKTYPMQNNAWGPFFEDVQGHSDTQINAITFARFILEHRQYFPNWHSDVPKIFDWVYATLHNDRLSKHGVKVFDEQTSFRLPGESHMAREGATELLYSVLSGDSSRMTGAIRQLTWASYFVDDDGKNLFPGDGNWLTDGYGDFVRHYLRAMSADPELAPAAAHILPGSSVIQWAQYRGESAQDPTRIHYRTYDKDGVDRIRLEHKPASVRMNNHDLSETPDLSTEGYRWTPLHDGGVLDVYRVNGNEVDVIE